jgi:hypothetical protein
MTKNWIMPVNNRQDAVNYGTREYWRMGSATILDDICWDSTNLAELAKYEHDAQAARIHRAASPLWLRQAQQALQAQQAAYAADDGNLLVKRGKAPSR